MVSILINSWVNKPIFEPNMIAAQISSQQLIPLKMKDSIATAIDLMIDAALLHLPIVDEKNQYLGSISLSALFEAKKGKVEDLIDQIDQQTVKPDDSLRHVLMSMTRYDLSMIAVVLEDGEYHSAVGQKDLVNFFARLQGAENPGGSLVLELNARDYALTHLAGIAESNEAFITSSYLMNQVDSDKILVYLQFNILDLSRIISAYERYDYRVVFHFHQSNLSDLLEERYDALMNYLNI